MDPVIKTLIRRFRASLKKFLESHGLGKQKSRWGEKWITKIEDYLQYFNGIKFKKAEKYGLILLLYPTLGETEDKVPAWFIYKGLGKNE